MREIDKGGGGARISVPTIVRIISETEMRLTSDRAWAPASPLRPWTTDMVKRDGRTRVCL